MASSGGCGAAPIKHAAASASRSGRSDGSATHNSVKRFRSGGGRSRLPAPVSQATHLHASVLQSCPTRLLFMSRWRCACRVILFED